MKFLYPKAEICAICDEGWIARIIEIQKKPVNEEIIYMLH